MSEALDNFNRLLPQLKERYHEILREKLETVNHLITAMRRYECTSAELLGLAVLIHGLKGSGTTLGAPEITGRAMELEAILPDPREKIRARYMTRKQQNKTLPLLEKFKDACERELGVD